MADWGTFSKMLRLNRTVRKGHKPIALVFEFGSHFHVIPPWLHVFSNFECHVYIPRKFTSLLKESLDSYEIYPYIEPIEKIPLVFLLRCLVNHKNKIILSTAREFKLTKTEFLLHLIICLVKPSVICIRNPNKWILERSSKNDRFILKINHKISTHLRVLIANRAQNVVSESINQSRLVNQEILKNISRKTISFPGRLTDVHPRIIELEDEKVLGLNGNLKLGLLGSLDPEKRDYETLCEAIGKIEIEKRPTVLILGSILPAGAQRVIDELTSITNVVVPKFERISESLFYTLGSRSDVLLAPLRTDRGYGAKFGTGSIADSFFLNKPLLIPLGIEIDFQDATNIEQYKNAVELTYMISKTWSFNYPTDTNSLNWLKNQIEV